VPIQILTWTAKQDLQDARNLITRVSDTLPLKLAAKAAGHWPSWTTSRTH
jgi:hypothetical protein